MAWHTEGWVQKTLIDTKISGNYKCLLLTMRNAHDNDAWKFPDWQCWPHDSHQRAQSNAYVLQWLQSEQWQADLKFMPRCEPRSWACVHDDGYLLESTPVSAANSNDPLLQTKPDSSPVRWYVLEAINNLLSFSLQ